MTRFWMRRLGFTSLIATLVVFGVIGISGCSTTTDSSDNAQSSSTQSSNTNDNASDSDNTSSTSSNATTNNTSAESSSSATNNTATGSSSSNTKDFSIIGKWKSVGDEGVGQAQPGAIIVFTDSECNLYSPRDTYAMYKDGNTLRLDATGLLGGTLNCTVVIVDNDHIELHTGSNVTKLQRVG